MVLQTSAPVQNPQAYKDRHWHAVTRLRLCFSAGRVQGPTKSGHNYYRHILHILHILHVLICLSTSAWLDQCQSALVYERREQAQVLYVIPVSSILGRLPLVPVGATGTKPFAMLREALTFPELSAIHQQTAVMVVGGGL